MSYCRRLQLASHAYRNLSSKFIIQSSNPLSKTCLRTISCSSIAQNNQTKWFQFQKKGTRNLMISCGVLGSLAYASWDTVPYINRTCRVFFPRIVDKLLGDLGFKLLLIINSEALIIEGHSEIVRLQSILSHIIKAAKSTNKRISSLSWEVFVIDNEKSDDIDLGPASGLPNGKIFISKQFLEDFTTDVEIAAAIGHEVAHVVARHQVENLTLKLVSWIPLRFVRLCTTDPQVLKLEKMEDIFYYYKRKREFEADYIGMMLMASAGYDPKSAPKYYLEVGRLYDDSCDSDSSPQTHPSSKQRVKKLFQVMEEAMTIYNSCYEKKVPSQSPGPSGGDSQCKVMP